MRFIKGLLGVMIFGLIFTASCKKEEDPTNYDAEDKKAIQDYISANNLDADSTSSGLYYVTIKEGTGKSPSQYSDVMIRYRGELLNGSVFDESNSGVRLNLSQVIQGWTEGVQQFKEGGHGWLLIPSSLGYGNQATGSIPANSVLVFEIHLDEVF